MLFILYGATSGMAYASMDYFTSKGFHIVEKYNYVQDSPQLHSVQKERNYISKEEFLENTDSLFRYELGGIHYGFNQSQISDAVCDKANALLLLAASNIDFIAEIKRVYENHVCLIYSHIDDTTLAKVIRNRPNITEEEVQVRLSIGKGVKNNYARHCALFDKAVIYSGADSIFDEKNLCEQYEAIIKEYKLETEEKKVYADVFLSYAHTDTPLCREIAELLQAHGITTYRDADLLADEDWKTHINDVIQHAKVVVPIVTANALKSSYVWDEVTQAVRSAENNGTLIIPFFYGDLPITDSPLYERLTLLRGVCAEQGDFPQKAKELAETLVTLFCSGDKLKALAEQIENYRDLAMYEQALVLQREHTALCEKTYALSKGRYVSVDSCLTSRAALIELLLSAARYEEALDSALDALHLQATEDNQTLTNGVADLFAACCAYCRFTETQVRALLEENLPVANEQIDDLVERFSQRLRLQNEGVSNAKRLREEEKTSVIAQHGETVLAAFDSLLSLSSTAANRQDLVVGYERLLNYCKHIGLRGEIADTCISRIAELKAQEDELSEEQHEEYSEALKIYLGQMKNNPGEYDVFISFKSQDEALAQKVYDYLTQAGKDVFFSKESLPHLGQSEYEEMIFTAIEHSKHMLVVASNPDYLKTPWVKEEWDTFNNEIREGRKTGNLLLVLTDDISYDKGRLPIQLRQKEIIKMSEHKTRLLSYLK